MTHPLSPALSALRNRAPAHLHRITARTILRHCLSPLPPTVTPLAGIASSPSLLVQRPRHRHSLAATTPLASQQASALRAHAPPSPPGIVLSSAAGILLRCALQESYCRSAAPGILQHSSGKLRRFSLFIELLVSLKPCRPARDFHPLPVTGVADHQPAGLQWCR